MTISSSSDPRSAPTSIAPSEVINTATPKFARYHEACICERPGCTNIVPAGKLAAHQYRVFCSDKCRKLAKNIRRKCNKIQIGNCEYCNGPIFVASKAVSYQKYCSVEHFRAAQYARIMMPAGPLRLILEEYLTCNAYYAESTFYGVKTNLARAAGYLHQELGVNQWEDVLPKHITIFIKNEKERGIKCLSVVGQLSTFFGWLVAVKGFKTQNPVIKRFHSQKSHHNDPRPLETDDITLARQMLVDNGDVALMLAFAIGEECGLRGGETCNIRVEDVDTVHRTIFVRLPTKNRVERIVPYNDQVAHYLSIWLEQRNSECGHDHLLHGPHNAPLSISSLDDRLRRLFAGVMMTGGKFVYHRLRHTWASNLYDSGMDLPVLQKLGGWLCLATLQVYVRVKKEKIEQQYQQAYERMKLRQQAPVEEIISMDEFLRMKDGCDVTGLQSAG